MAYGITKDLERCRELLKKGDVVALPTETVYGLAANIFDESAVQKIFKTKDRPKFNPLIVHIHKLEQLFEIANRVPDKALLLAKAFWPGPLTLILPKKENISDLITAGKPTVGVRMPNHKLTLELLSGLDFSVAAPSANPFTRVSPTSAEHVHSYFGDKVTVLDGGSCQVGLESTIVGFDGEEPVIYRKGGISVEAIEERVGMVRAQLNEEKAPVAPGMLLKHYSPRTRLVLTDNLDEALKTVEEKRVGVLSFYREDFENIETFKVLSVNKSLEEAAKNLFHSLHELDAIKLDIIIAEKLPEEGLGSAINDRLKRAQNA